MWEFSTHYSMDGRPKNPLHRANRILRSSSNLTSLVRHWSAIALVSLEALDSISCDVVSVMNTWNQIVRFQPVIHELLLHENIKYLFQQVRALKEMLVERDHALQMTAQKLHASPGSGSPPPASSGSSITAAMLSAKASSFAARLRATSEPKGEDAELQQQRAHHVSDMITRALLAEEMERFRYANSTFDYGVCWLMNCDPDKTN